MDSSVTDWEARVADPAIVSLIEDAWSGNPGLAQLAAQVEQARAEARIAGSVVWPQVSLGAEAEAMQLRLPGFPGRIREDRLTAAGQLSWEVDLWGRLRATRDAAGAAYVATVRDYEAARLSLAGTAVRLWYDLAEARAQARLAVSTLEIFERAERIAVRRFESGVGDAVDLHLARANSASARQVVALREQQRDAFARSLQVLLGRYPDGMEPDSAELPDEPEPVTPGLPAELLERRPDIRAAAARHEAAANNVQAASRARLPALRLTGASGFVSSELGNLLSSESFFWNLAAGLSAPLIDGGRLSAERRGAVAQLDAAAQAYAAAVLEALREVETALAAAEWLRDQQTALEAAARESSQAESLAIERYQRGIVAFSTVLEAQRRTFDNRSRLLSVRTERHKNHIGLILALGGDFLRAADGTPQPEFSSLP